MRSKISFRLNRGLKFTDNEPKPIYLRFRFGRALDFNGSTGYFIKPSQWNFEQGQPKRQPATIKDYHLITARIEGLINHFSKFMQLNELEQLQPTRKAVKKHFDNYLKAPTPTAKEMSLFEFIASFIKKSETQLNPTTKKLISKGTRQTYVRVNEILKEFNDEVYKLDFDRIDYEFYTDFIEWCNMRVYSTNYIGKLIKILKTFLNEATEQGINKNVAFRSRKFAVLSEESDSIYLSLPELSQMWNVDLSNRKELETARNLFLIGAYTGLRVSDYSQLTADNFRTINGVQMLRVKTQKTGLTVAIPLHPITKQIIKETPHVLTSSMTSQKINEHIKDVGILAKIKGNETQIITKGGKQVEKLIKKYNLITTHTARRSFCTNAYLSGMPTIDIMTISGHKTEKNFLKYIKATPEQKAIKLASSEFFNPDSPFLRVV